MTRTQVLIVEVAASLLVAYVTGRGLNNKVNRIAQALEQQAANTRPQPVRVFICRRMPHAGQMDWVSWLKDNGECELATETW